MLPWLLGGLALLLGWASWARAGRLARRLEALTQSYWELRYDYTRLRSHVARLDRGERADDDDAPAPQPAAQTVAFVPLSSMKKKN